MSTFDVKYRTKFFPVWRTVRGVKGDAIPNFLGESHILLVREDDSIVLIPREGTIFEISAGRHKLIQERMHQESNGVIPKE